MVDIYIRPYKPGDRNDCIAIFKSNIPKYFAESELEHFNAWLDAQDEERPAYSNAMEDDFFVARLDGKIVGCGGFYILRDETKAKLVWGIVEYSLHRKGIGKALLVHRINSIEILYPGYKICMDTTQLSKPFFEKMGFKTEKAEKDYYASGLDKYEMVLG
jgi:ribosomal-protein-alanine N-acetyltransferase